MSSSIFKHKINIDFVNLQFVKFNISVIMLTSEAIMQYAALHSTPQSEVLAALAADTEANVPGAQMLTGHIAGAFLSMISKLIAPKVIIELGTYTGYSAIYLAQGLSEGGVLHTFDIDDRWDEMRRQYWSAAGVEDKIVQHIGDAATLLPTLELVPDLVFIDADKKMYFHYLTTCLEKMQSGGIILVDNVLFKGEVLLPDSEQKNAARYIHEFNEKLKNIEGITYVLLPIRDGITMIRKK